MTSPSYLAVKKNDSSNWTVEQLCRKTIDDLTGDLGPEFNKHGLVILLNVTDKKRDVVIHVAGMSRLEVLGALEFAKDAVLSGQ